MQVLQHARENPWTVKVYSRGAALIVLLSGHMAMAGTICRHLLAEATNQIHGIFGQWSSGSHHCSVSIVLKLTSIAAVTNDENHELGVGHQRLSRQWYAQ